jgi:hypothetical protein
MGVFSILGWSSCELSPASDERADDWASLR